MIFQKIRN